MKVLKISSIKGYKSFSDFSWSKYCKKQNKDGVCIEPTMSGFSVFFGENGSGKSSVCDILKNLSGNKDDLIAKPESVEILIEDNSQEATHSFSSGNWNAAIPSSSILFFDVDFINSNVHTNGVRSSNLQSGAHTQKSGKLIIDLDQKANELNNAVNQAKYSIDVFDKSNNAFLLQKPTDLDLKLYEEYIKTPKESIALTLSDLELKKSKEEKSLTTLGKLQTKSADLNKIQTPVELTNTSVLSDVKIYQEIFSRVIEKKTNTQVDQTIKDHFDKHKSFIESAKDQLPEDYLKSNCPLCMQPLKNATKVIEYYRSVYDKTFEINKRQFLADVENLITELSSIKVFIESLENKTNQIFDVYETIKNDFELLEVYKVEDKSNILSLINKLDTDPVKKLLICIEGLRSIERKQIDPVVDHKAIADLIEKLNEILGFLNKTIKSRNLLIDGLKAKYTDTSKIQTDIDSANKRLEDIKTKIDFLMRDKLSQLTKWRELSAEKEKLIETRKTCEKARDEYITQKVPENIISKMIAVLDKFNLNFTVEPFKLSTNTKDYAFAFKIKDCQGNERELKDGLSEGERQLISLSFFFAINDNVSDKSSKIIIFDDPITSLDAPNLKILAELIHAQISKYSQVIVFTHHPLFHKYLVKPDIPNKAKFGILKNSDIFGGSFIFSDPSYNMIDEVKLCNQEISSKATSGTLKLEEISLKYGQLLRLAVEKFIKHELLMWNKEGDFGSQIVCNLKSSKSKISKLTEDDLDTLTNIYNYCNQSNLLHVDKENPSALSELLNNINRFAAILDKSKS